MNIVLFGPPGAGKGTQSALLIERKSMQHLSTGDLLRNAIKTGTELGTLAKSYMDKGDLVPDEVMIGIVNDVLKGMEDSGFILDGFPRTVLQAEALDEMLVGLNKSLDKAIFLDVPREDLVKRLSGRRVCTSCGASYHIEHKPTQVEGVCDRCGGTVEQRVDDQEESILNRLDVYENSTKPLKGFYETQGRLVELNGLGETEEVFTRLEQQL